MTEISDKKRMCFYCARLAGQLIKEALIRAGKHNLTQANDLLDLAINQAKHDDELHLEFPDAKPWKLRFDVSRVEEIRNRLQSK